MQPVIDDMVTRYETGKLSRRELIRGLTLLAAAGPALAAGSSQTPPLQAAGIDHICVRVKDLERAAQFYGSLFGVVPLGEDKEHRILRLGVGKHVMVSLRQDEPYGSIDHFCIKVDGFKKDEATRVLQERGLTTHEDWEYGFYVRDPDNAVVQML
ncbi:MAG TPA: VOC family protein [Steroidobacteraceae bacterium]|jgi:catechol 2,3-dioxygenase-like lactoylglutathione lyase family enzyme|nr:VOC family protein [Steroidobacteraceae bacterium]